VLTLLAAIASAVAAASLWQLRRVAGRLEDLELRLRRSTTELETLENAFTRFAPHEIVERIIADGIATEAETKDITILFADLKDFTPMAEELEPSQLMVVLNGYFESMGQAIAANRGYLSKFIGDGLLALFGALEPNPWHTNDALHAALAMRAALTAYNERLREQGLPTLAMGMGIHRGPVVAGVLGTSSVKEYGVLGRNVNVASRVEDLTRVHGTDILVTEAVRIRCDPRFQLREMPPAEAKGIAEPVVTYCLTGFDPA